MIVHVTPANDTVEHDTDGGECVCGPTPTPTEHGWIMLHHSLDGREQRERER